jgi:hypothetical protein
MQANFVAGKRERKGGGGEDGKALMVQVVPHAARGLKDTQDEACKARRRGLITDGGRTVPRRLLQAAISLPLAIFLRQPCCALIP